METIGNSNLKRSYYRYRILLCANSSPAASWAVNFLSWQTLNSFKIFQLSASYGKWKCSDSCVYSKNFLSAASNRLQLLPTASNSTLDSPRLHTTDRTLRKAVAPMQMNPDANRTIRWHPEPRGDTVAVEHMRDDRMTQSANNRSSKPQERKRKNKLKNLYKHLNL